jgi:hypothetical protein
MECEIDIGGEGEPIEGFERGLRTLGVDIACGECGRMIPAGVQHEVATGQLEDEDLEFHTCTECDEIARALQVEGRDYGFLWAQLEDHGGENEGGAFEHFNSGCLKKMKTAKAKSYLVERFNKWKGLTAPTVERKEAERDDSAR